MIQILPFLIDLAQTSCKLIQCRLQLPELSIPAHSVPVTVITIHQPLNVLSYPCDRPGQILGCAQCNNAGYQHCQQCAQCQKILSLTDTHLLPVKHTDHHYCSCRFLVILIDIDRRCNPQDHHTIHFIKIRAVSCLSPKRLIQYIIHFIGQTFRVRIGVIRCQRICCLFIAHDPHIDLICPLQFIDIRRISGKPRLPVLLRKLSHTSRNDRTLPAQRLRIRTHIIGFIQSHEYDSDECYRHGKHHNK